MPRVHQGAGLNVIGVQEDQHENVLIAVLRGQVDLQHQLLSTQKGRIQQNDVKVAAIAARVGLMGGHGASVSMMIVLLLFLQKQNLTIGGHGTAGCRRTAINPGRNTTTGLCIRLSERRRGHLGPSQHCASFHHR